MNTPFVGAILEQSTMPIEEKIAERVTALTRQICCDAHCCNGREFCNVARHEYKMLWVNEWRDYARDN